MSTTLQILLAAAKAAPIALDNEGRQSYIEIGIVTDNLDPANLRRIRVTTASKGGLTSSNWLMPVFDCATHDKPLPLIGATVVVGWFGGNPNNGFWLGAIANDTNKPFPKENIIDDDWRTIPGKSTYLVAKDQLYGIGGNQDVAVQGSRFTLVGGSDRREVGGDNCVMVEGKQVIHIEEDRVLKIEKKSIHQANIFIEIAAGLNVTIRNGAGAKIELKPTGHILLKSGDGMTMPVGRLPRPPLPLSNPDLDCENTTSTTGGGATSLPGNPNPNSRYLTQAQGDELYVPVSHLSASDPHPQYLTQTEGDTLYAGAGAFSTHVAASDPHPQYLTQTEGDTLYAGAGAFSTHVAASDPHPQYLTQTEGDTLYAPNNAIASHLAASNPHSITPTLIGAAPTSHTHTGSQVSGNISGNAANVTGVVEIANGGTGASTAATALTNLGAAAVFTPQQSLNYYSGWGTYHPNSYVPTFSKIDKLVILSGVVTRTSGALTSIFLLPSGFRPISRRLFIAWSVIDNIYTLSRVDVDTNGVVYFIHPTTSSQIDWLSLDGICFVS